MISTYNAFCAIKKLYAGTMGIDKANVQIYSNSNYKGKKSIKIGKDPHQALQKVALDMKLEKLKPDPQRYNLF